MLLDYVSTKLVDCLGDSDPIQDFDTIVSSEISLEMESFNMCKESLISMVIETFDRLRSGLNSFHGELLLVDHHTGGEHRWWTQMKIEVCTFFVTLCFRKIISYW